MGIDILSEQQFEFFLIGTGNYGESIIINAGQSNWIVVDSCIDPKTKECLPLRFLINKGVNIEQDVKLIVCTHWHDDHIRGISNLLQECKSADFSMAIASDKIKFLQFVQLDYKKIESEVSAVSTAEINKCLHTINNENRRCILATQDKMIWSAKDFANNYKSKIYALSPSDKVIREYGYEISALMNEYGASNRKIVPLDPNDKSVVLLIEVNEHSILLGADLEVIANDYEKGWLCILDNSQIIKMNNNKPSIFKLPHHGSQNGHHERIWQELIADNTAATLTSCHQGNLPRQNMIDIFFEFTDKLYLTSLPKQLRVKKRSFSTTKAISEFNPTVKELPFTYGVVSGSIEYKGGNKNWCFWTEGNAVRLDKKP